MSFCVHVFTAETVWNIDQYLSVSKRFCVNTHFYLLFLLSLSLKMSVTQQSFACSLACFCFKCCCNYFISRSIGISWQKKKTIHTYRTIVFIIHRRHTSIPIYRIFICLTSIFFHFLFGWRNIAAAVAVVSFACLIRCLCLSSERPSLGSCPIHTWVYIASKKIYALFAFVLIVVFIFLVL